MGADINSRIRAEVRRAAARLEAEGRLREMRKFRQHGSVSVYQHCLQVAITSCRIASYIPVSVNKRELIRGALLHDYFLYDWHARDNNTHRLHGFFHPGRALKNAQEDFELTSREKEIIRRHMFPLTPIPPTNREAWIVCLADKFCALRETIKR